MSNGCTCPIITNGDKIIGQLAEQSPDLVLMEIDNHARTWERWHTIKQRSQLPSIALLRREILDTVNGHPGIDDFIVEPYDVTELLLRIRRLINTTPRSDSNELIRCDDLMIDLAKCEVSVGSNLTMLTYREYELLKFLAKNRGRVFTREALLNKVWGYDYLGGDRTVDVHIRRLRSKIEDSSHTFIETVRNIGYRFIKIPSY